MITKQQQEKLNFEAGQKDIEEYKRTISNFISENPKVDEKYRLSGITEEKKIQHQKNVAIRKE